MMYLQRPIKAKYDPYDEKGYIINILAAGTSYGQIIQVLFVSDTGKIKVDHVDQFTVIDPAYLKPNRRKSVEKTSEPDPMV